MSDFIIWIPLVLVVAAGAFILLRRGETGHASDPGFVADLDSFTTAVHESSLNYNASLAPGEAAMAKLSARLDQVSGETRQDLETLSLLWQEMSNQIEEYQAQPTSSTLQSSILTTRLAKQRDVINNLAGNIRNRYE